MRRSAAAPLGWVCGLSLVSVPAGGSALQPPSASGRTGERDPFSWPAGFGGSRRAPGLAGVRIAEAVVRGTVLPLGPEDELRTGGTFGFALIETPSGEGFVAEPGARLHDGVLERIEAAGAVFRRLGDPDRELFRPLAPAAAGSEAR